MIFLVTTSATSLNPSIDLGDDGDLLEEFEITRISSSGKDRLNTPGNFF
jgi:hypothetical protein